MFKKKLLTLAALAFCAAIVTAQTTARTVPTSLVNEATAGLIEDDAIDSLPFGNEDGKGIVFGKFVTGNNGKIELGWGNAFGDALWLSIYDAIAITGDEEKEESVRKFYGYNNTVGTNGDGVNTDYVDERPRQINNATGNTFNFRNDLAVGVGINNKIGVQIGWYANWTEKKDVAVSLTAGKALGAENDPTEIKKDETTSSSGLTESTKYDKIKNYTRNNVIAFGFKGIGIEDDGEVPFYANLKNVYSSLDFDTKSENYSYSKDFLGANKQSVTADGINQTITIRPGVKAVAGFNFADWGVVKPSVSFEEDFNIGFDIVKNKTNYNDVLESNTDTRITTDTTYEYKPGKKLSWTNTLTPKVGFDFALLDQLTLKASASAAIQLDQYNKEAGKTKKVATETTYTRSTGLSTVKTVTTEAGDSRNTKQFTTTVTPEIDLGLVYAVIPEKTNINFGVKVAPGSYKWKTTESTNSNINTVTTTENKDAQGDASSYTTVSMANNSAETLKKEFDADPTSATLHIGATWFFTEDVKFDVYYSNAFGSLFGNANTFGAEFSVKF